jgi:DNA-binding HxlR family transcriptional regulator
MSRNTDAASRSKCALNAFLNLFGDRWSLLVVRDLWLGDPRGFKELLSAEEGIATNVLADRLRRLESHGIVTRRPHATDARKGVYLLSEKGAELVPVLIEMALWAAKHESSKTWPLASAPTQERVRLVVGSTPAFSPRRCNSSASGWSSRRRDPRASSDRHAQQPRCRFATEPARSPSLGAEEVDLAATVLAKVSDYTPLITENGRDIVFEGPTSGVVAKGNIRAIESIVGNLLDNAVRANPPGGAVLVSVDHDAAAITDRRLWAAKVG